MVDCKVTCVSDVFVFLDVVRLGCIGEILCCVVVAVVWTIFCKSCLVFCETFCVSGKNVL